MTDVISYISEKAWGEYKESDYTTEQWHNACLIHLHDGAPTSKSSCKLPVKTPNGSVNRNGVHAAAAALAGARGGVDAPSEKKVSASRSLVRLYSQLEEDPPASIKELAHMDVTEFLAHYGVRGMRWGVRRGRLTGRRRAGDRTPPSEDFTNVRSLRGRPISTLSNAELRRLNERMNLEQQYSRLNPNPVRRGRNYVQGVLGTVGVGVAAYNVLNSPAGRAMREQGNRLVDNMLDFNLSGMRLTN